MSTLEGLNNTDSAIAVEGSGVRERRTLHLFERLARAQVVLAAMAVMQIVWLAGIWVTGAAPNTSKLWHLAIYTILMGMLVIFMPAGFASRLRDLKERFVQNDKAFILTLCLLVLLVGVVYAYSQRLWPYDEAHNFEAARIVAEQGPGALFADYAKIDWLGRWHPPLTPLLYGFAMRTFGVSLFVARLVPLMMVLGTTVITYYLGRDLYDREVGVLAAFLLISFPLVFRQGTAAMTDVPVMFFFSLGIFLVLRMVRTPSYQLAGVAGLSIGAGLISKYTMLFIYPVLFSLFVTQASFRRLKTHFALVVLISGGILATWLIYAYFSGMLAAFETELVTEFEPGYFVTDAHGTMWLINTLLTKLTSALGPYNLPLLILGAWHLVRHRQQPDWILLLWVGVVSVLLIFTLPDHRYFMPTFPALAIIMVRAFKYIRSASERATLLALLLCGGALYLFVDWSRTAELFAQ